MDYVGKANRYIKAVLTGKILACRFLVLACKRQEKDLKRKKAKTFRTILTRKKRTAYASSLNVSITSRGLKQENLFILRIGSALF